MKKKGFLSIGKIVGTHGIKGNLKVYSYAESASIFNPGNSILVSRAGKIEQEFKIAWARPHGRRMLVSFKEIADLNAAETLIGSELLVERVALPELEKGSYYWCDIIGLSVFTTDEQYIGRLESIIPTGSNDVFVVKDPDKGSNNEILIPGIESVVIKIDFEHKKIYVNLPEGL